MDKMWTGTCWSESITEYRPRNSEQGWIMWLRSWRSNKPWWERNQWVSTCIYVLGRCLLLSKCVCALGRCLIFVYMYMCPREMSILVVVYRCVLKRSLLLSTCICVLGKCLLLSRCICILEMCLLLSHIFVSYGGVYCCLHVSVS